MGGLIQIILEAADEPTVDELNMLIIEEWHAARMCQHIENNGGGPLDARQHCCLLTLRLTANAFCWILSKWMCQFLELKSLQSLPL